MPDEKPEEMTDAEKLLGSLEKFDLVADALGGMRTKLMGQGFTPASADELVLEVLRHGNLVKRAELENAAREATAAALGKLFRGGRQ